mmetsp:Transcript_51092/g.141487  ORF Transcript_51092/g.141487 Transcript_51092/m.141487 type:complete len:206 (+) Transcript_51092:1099-1716(+)
MDISNGSIFSASCFAASPSLRATDKFSLTSKSSLSSSETRCRCSLSLRDTRSRSVRKRSCSSCSMVQRSSIDFLYMSRLWCCNCKSCRKLSTCASSCSRWRTASTSSPVTSSNRRSAAPRCFTSTSARSCSAATRCCSATTRSCSATTRSCSALRALAQRSCSEPKALAARSCSATKAREPSAARKCTSRICCCPVAMLCCILSI